MCVEDDVVSIICQLSPRVYNVEDDVAGIICQLRKRGSTMCRMTWQELSVNSGNQGLQCGG
jgi:hypothetical protein